MARVFVIRPFGKKNDSKGKEIDFDLIHSTLIEPALREAGLSGSTTGEIIDSGNIRSDMFSLILAADVAICDITVLNANVFYELGVRHALRKKRTIMIRGVPTADQTPFDLLTDRYMAYELANPSAHVGLLTRTIRASLASERDTDSPIFQMLPSLAEADPAKSRFVVPSAFKENVDLAVSAQSTGWLRLLAEEVRTRPFGNEGLRLVAKAQWDLKDWDGARESWESIAKIYPHDVDANLALANIYERIYRATKDHTWLSRSDVAVQRLLESDTTQPTRAEALALKARNLKTRWRLTFEKLEALAERRRKAVSADLLESYRAYREAFFSDLNHYYPGSNALQLGTILLDLSQEESWADMFQSDPAAEQEKTNLRLEVANLGHVVPTSVEAAKERAKGDTDIWHKVTSADVVFLTNSRVDRIIKAYEQALPSGASPFAWDAAKGQLELFASLGVRAELARAVIDKMDPRFSAVGPTTQPTPLQVIMFAGHRIDVAGRVPPRFPPALEQKARDQIRAKLKGILAPNSRYEAYASASPGADIIFHEVCKELGIPSKICLPMPANHYAREVFVGLDDDWRNRFIKLNDTLPVLLLSDQIGLPSWLEGAGIEPWGRGNKWVLKIATTRQAAKVCLLAFWDGKVGDGPGGTDDMVRIARDEGRVEIHIADARELTSSN